MRNGLRLRSRTRVGLALLCGCGSSRSAARDDPNEADADGTTALHWAVHRGDLESGRRCSRPARAVNAANRYGVRPAYLAAENGDAATMRALLDGSRRSACDVRGGRDVADDGCAHRRRRRRSSF